ncbi:peptide chain release factor 1-like, mitochondrial, partial [Carlito syrichta]
MRSRLLWGAARCLWALGATGPARRPLSCDTPPLEELFARDGSLRTFLERQAGSGALVSRPQLASAAKLLSEKEGELREIEHLLR